MRHELPVDRLGPRGEAMAEAVQACVHCGFCLPTCPTYRVLGQEMDSPRGRIFLMKEVLEGNLQPEQAQVHIDRCLGCLACETSCPSGVKYGELLSPYRALRREQGAAGGHPLRRWLAAMTLPYAARFRWAMRLGQIGRKLRFVTPKVFWPMLDLVPDSLPSAIRLPDRTPAEGTRETDCAFGGLCPTSAGTPDQCGGHSCVSTQRNRSSHTQVAGLLWSALSWHIGDDKSAANFARTNLTAFPIDVDAIVTTAAGCGSGLHDYPLMLAGTEEEPRAKQLAAMTVDISTYLDRIGIETPPPLEKPLRVAYHDACHLGHAQRIRSQPRRILKSIPGIELIEISDPEICCGSAGTYNIDQPEIAAQLGQEKAQSIIATNAQVVALGNIGCSVQIERYLKSASSSIRVMHTIELLDMAYRQQSIPISH